MRNLKMLVLMLVVLLGATSVASAQGGSMTSLWKSKYVGVDGAEFYGGSVTQADIDFLIRSCGVNVWGSTGFNSRRDFDKEVDLTGRCTKTIGKMILTVSGGYFYIAPVIDVLTASVEVSTGIAYGRLEFYRPRKKGGPDSGQMLILGLRKSVKVSERLTLSIDPNFRYDDGAFGFNPGWLVQGRVGATVTLTDSTSILAGLRLSKPMNIEPDGRRFEKVWEIGLSRSWK